MMEPPCPRGFARKLGPSSTMTVSGPPAQPCAARAWATAAGIVTRSPWRAAPLPSLRTRARNW